MKKMLFLFILFFNSSFEKNLAADSFLENIDSKTFSPNEKKTFTVDGYLGNGDSKEYTSSGYCVYLDVLEFDEKRSEINVTVTVHKGKFLENVMYYKGSDEEKANGEKVEFNTSKIFYEEDKGSYSHDKLYSKYTYIFKIPKSNNNYIYVSIPEVILTSDGYVEISVNKKLPGWAIVLIVIGSVGVLVIIIILYMTSCCKYKLSDSCEEKCSCCRRD